MVATERLGVELAGRGITQTRPWSRGIDHWLFRPTGEMHPAFAALPRPIMLNVGRVAPEKNLEAFLDAKVAGTKVVVGDGPSLEEMKQRYPEVVFLGALAGEELAAAYRSADCFVFPSLTDTFGMVVIEALASGLPVAAFPVAGPLDIVGRNGRGPRDDMPFTAAAIEDDLTLAIEKALRLDRTAASIFGARFSWERATDQFVEAIRGATRRSAAERELEPA
jgi:glycosyltransferase involved in cell wall biosynthesis